MQPLSAKPLSSQTGTHAQRWSWFLDVVFGAIIALGIEAYQPVLKQMWALGTAPFARSLVVAFCTTFFVVYDIAIYHALVHKYPYRMTVLGFGRFFLDLIMAFILYALLINAFESHPDWHAILYAISGWHLAALIWHLTASHEHKQSGQQSDVAALPHLIFIMLYWFIAYATSGLAQQELALERNTADQLTLLVLSLTILAVSVYRWRQVIKQLTG